MKSLNNKFKLNYSSLISGFLLVISIYLMTRNFLLSFIAFFIFLSSNLIFGYYLQKEYSKYEEHKEYYLKLKDLLNNGICLSKENEKKKNVYKVEFEEIINRKVDEFRLEKRKFDLIMNITNIIVGLLYLILGIVFFLIPTISSNFKNIRGNLFILIILFVLYIFYFYISYFVQKKFIQSYLKMSEKEN